MRISGVIVASLFLIILAFGCGGVGSDPEFSPDPTVGGEDGGGDDGGGVVEVEVPETDEEENDCFLDGFCERACTTASECPEGFSCVMQICTFDCQSDEECGAGGVCNDQGLCEASDGTPMAECASDEECGDGRFCNAEGACEKIPVLLGCRDSADCPLGQYCDDAHECELFPGAGIECSSNEECPGGYHCDQSNLCAQECLTDQQCAIGQACSADGFCVDAGSPSKVSYFSFNSVGAAIDPSDSAVFESPNYRIDLVEIAPVGRMEVLTSKSYRLIGNAATVAEGGGGDSYIPYQGHLIDSDGQDVTRSVHVEVRLYDSFIAGMGQGVENSHVIYADDHPTAPVDGGIFRVGIGDGSPLDPDEPSLPVDKLIEAENVYMELWIDGERLSPRQGLGSMPAVFHADYARYADEVENMPAITENDLPNYPAELITDGTLAGECIPSGLDVSKIDGSLSADRVPNLSVDDFDDLGSLPPEVIAAMDAEKINGGTIDKERLPTGSYVERNNLMVMSGSISHGQMLVFPSGFEPGTAGVQCEYLLTPGITMGSVEGIDQIYLENNNNVIRCEVDWHEAEDQDSHTAQCTANYMIICKREL